MLERKMDVKEDLTNLVHRIGLSAELADKLENLWGVKLAGVCFGKGEIGVNLEKGIEKLINGAGIKCVSIEDGIVSCEFGGAAFYQYVLPEERKRVFEELKLF